MDSAETLESLSFASGLQRAGSSHSALPPASVASSVPGEGDERVQVAVKDFSIKADYVFWSKVGATAAKEVLHIQQQRNQELTCSMKLALPDLVVDIKPWQFYIVLNVVRNVLLVPPPVVKAKVRAGAGVWAERLPRDRVSFSTVPFLLCCLFLIFSLP